MPSRREFMKQVGKQIGGVAVAASLPASARLGTLRCTIIAVRCCAPFSLAPLLLAHVERRELGEERGLRTRGQEKERKKGERHTRAVHCISFQ